VEPDKRARKRQARKAKSQARAAFHVAKGKGTVSNQAAVVEKPAAPAQKEQPTNTAGAKLSITQEVLDQTPLLPAELLLALVQSLDADVVPAAFEPRSAEDVLNHMIGVKGPTAVATNRVKLEAEVQQLKCSLDMLGNDGLAEAVKALEAEIKLREVKLAKLVRDAPSPNVEAKALAEMRSAYELRAQARKDHEEKGRAKAEERVNFGKSTRRASSSRWR